MGFVPRVVTNQSIANGIDPCSCNSAGASYFVESAPDGIRPRPGGVFSILDGPAERQAGIQGSGAISSDQAPARSNFGAPEGKERDPLIQGL